MKTITNKMAAVLSVLMLVSTPFANVGAEQASVGIYDNSFTPQTITVTPGSTVIWTNLGSNPHTVTSDFNLFNSGTLTPGSSYTVTFPTPGTYRYYCQFHGGGGGNGMSGVVIVQEGGSGQSTTNTLSATVVQPTPTPIIINSITPVQTAGTADNTFEHGWKWIYDVTVPANEPNLAMKFDNWLLQNSGTIIPVANNMRFYSAHSSNAPSANSAIYITSAGNYSNWMFLNGDLDSNPQTRRVHITVESRIPTGTQTGTYTTNFGIKTQ